MATDQEAPWGFPGRTCFIDERRYLSFEDYLKWRGRRNKGDLKSRMRRGLMVATWNHWVESQGREGVAALADITVGKLDCYLDGYRYGVCGDAPELAEEVSLRESLLVSLRLGKPGEDRYRQRVEQWKELALRILPEIYILRRSIASINQRYFEGREVLFPAEAEGFDRLLALMEKLVCNYNKDLASSLDREEKLLGETIDGHQPNLLTVELAGLIESVQEAVKEQVAYMVDMAKADAVGLLGENRQALELVDRHV